jgi:hypothetical protein
VSRRLLVALWLVMGVVVWNGFFDLYISRGAREYLQKEAEFELKRGAEPSMTSVMDNAKHDGMVASTVWAVLVTGAGWATVWLASRRPRDRS